MPDPTLKTVSATQMPALCGVSPYDTPFTLYQKFTGALPDVKADSRMDWGLKMQPLVLEQAAEDLALEVRPNDEVYHRRGLLGATRDATLITPDRGPGAVDAKCVFDFRTWMENWHEGTAPPKHVDVQLQMQMYVGDGSESFSHGTIAAWVCGEMHYFHREPIKELWAEFGRLGAEFLDRVKHHDQPDPFGVPIELPALSLLPRVESKVIDLSEDLELAEVVRQYAWEQREARVAGKHASELKAQILAAAGDAQTVLLADGMNLKITSYEVPAHERSASRTTRIKPYIPDAAAPTKPPRERSASSGKSKAKTSDAIDRPPVNILSGG